MEIVVRGSRAEARKAVDLCISRHESEDDEIIEIILAPAEFRYAAAIIRSKFPDHAQEIPDIARAANGEVRDFSYLGTKLHSR